jgi:hypothetical protein
VTASARGASAAIERFTAAVYLARPRRGPLLIAL